MKISNDDTFMTQTKNKNAILTQVLVRNYLKMENKDANVFLYGELINDIDTFTSNLSRIDELKSKFNARIPSNEPPKTIDAFLSLIDDYDIDYQQSYDVKYKNELLFEDLLKLITKLIYPKNTQVQIIFVSSDTSNFDKLSKTPTITCFNKYKHEMLSLSNADIFTVVNSLVNDSTYRKKPLMDALIMVLNKLHRKTLTLDYKQNVTDDYVKVFKQNLEKITIRELTLKELLDVPLTRETLMEEYDLC